MLFQPVRVVFFRILELRQQDFAADVVAVLFAQRHALGQVRAHRVLDLQVALQHLLDGLAGREGFRTHVRVALQEQDAPQQRVGVLGFFLHFVVDAVEQRLQAHVLVAPREDEILVARGQFAAQQELEVVDDVRVAFHGGTAPVARRTGCPIPPAGGRIGISRVRRRTAAWTVIASVE